MALRLSLRSLRRTATRESSRLPDLIQQAEKTVQSWIQGGYVLRRAGSGEQFWQFRDYTGADRAQDIDWRQSAKTDKLYVRQREWQTNRKTYLWCDPSPRLDYRSDNRLETKRTVALVVSIAVASLLQRGKEAVHSFGASGRQERGDQFDHIARQLYQHQPDLSSLLKTQRSSYSRALLFSDGLAPLTETEIALRQQNEKRGRRIFIQILDPAELTFPFTGRTVFEPMDISETNNYETSNAASIRQAYQQKIMAHNAELEALCRRLNWDYMLHVTDRPYHEGLTALYKILSRPALEDK